MLLRSMSTLSSTFRVLSIQYMKGHVEFPTKNITYHNLTLYVGMIRELALPLIEMCKKQHHRMTAKHHETTYV